MRSSCSSLFSMPVINSLRKSNLRKEFIGFKLQGHDSLFRGIGQELK